MGAEDLRKNLKKKKKTNKNKEDHAELKSSELLQIDETPSKLKGEKRKKKPLEQRKRNKDEADQVDQSNILENTVGEKKKSKLLRHKTRKHDNVAETESNEVDKLDHEMEDGDVKEVEDHNKRKSKKKKRRHEKQVGVDKIDNETLRASLLEAQNQVDGSEKLDEASIGTNVRTRKGKKARKTENMEHLSSKDEQDLLKKRKEAEGDEVYQISSGDEDSSKGMRKWITEYHRSRPGLKVLQERIDDFITTHEAQEEQARQEREAQAAEGGWTVVVHHKGRKKTTDLESGIAVGSVAQAAVLDKMAKKKNTDVGLDFYRFQKREAHRNEIMMLQSKFEQDKKRIQQLRAQRKFRPY